MTPRIMQGCISGDSLTTFCIKAINLVIQLWFQYQVNGERSLDLASGGHGCSPDSQEFRLLARNHEMDLRSRLDLGKPEGSLALAACWN